MARTAQFTTLNDRTVQILDNQLAAADSSLRSLNDAINASSITRSVLNTAELSNARASLTNFPPRFSSEAEHLTLHTQSLARASMAIANLSDNVDNNYTKLALSPALERIQEHLQTAQDRIASSFAYTENTFGPMFSESAASGSVVADVLRAQQPQQNLDMDMDAARTYVQSLSRTPDISISAAVPAPTDLGPNVAANNPAQNIPQPSHTPSIDRGGYSM